MFQIFKTIMIALSMFGLVTHYTHAQSKPNNFIVTPIANNVYSVVSPSVGLPTPANKGWNSNIHFVVTGKGVLLFDTGSSEAIGHQIKKAIRSITPQPVRWIVNSHSHADHWLGNAAFADTATEIITSYGAFNTMKKHGPSAVKFYAKVTKGTIGNTQLVYPTLLLTQGQKRNFGGLEIEFIFANNGHSPGDILMWLPQQKIIFGGDVLSSDWMPMITGHGNVPNLIRTLRAIAKLRPKVVLTGHGKATNAQAIKRDADLLASVWQQVKTNYAQGIKLEATLATVKTTLEAKYSPLYKNFTAEIERYVKLMYKLQQ